ncbi:Uncharacterized protein Fot_50912 [Forsythia ovata]|uniref:Uncharacterized protein n=1 Tax=Forsythia ovata TaxID=205694 RepID=A0ABD1PXT5_9LAMI
MPNSKSAAQLLLPVTVGWLSRRQCWTDENLLAELILLFNMRIDSREFQRTGKAVLAVSPSSFHCSPLPPPGQRQLQSSPSSRLRSQNFLEKFAVPSFAESLSS